MSFGSGGLFSGLSVVICADEGEDLSWIAQIIATARPESNEVLVVVPADSDAIAMRPGIGSWENVRIVKQTGVGKSNALNEGLARAKNQFVIFLDSDIDLQPGQLSTVLQMLQDGESFVSVGYGGHAPSLPVFGFCSGWFFGARRSTFIGLGGWASGYLEDHETGKRILKSENTIAVAGFVVRLRRPVRHAPLKFLSVLTSFGRK